MFGEEMRQVGFKEPIGKVEAIDRRAASLGLKRSEYLRMLVERDLALAAAN
jgi:predicted DNA binding CopG/RHH family protein